MVPASIKDIGPPVGMPRAVERRLQDFWPCKPIAAIGLRQNGVTAARPFELMAAFVKVTCTPGCGRESAAKRATSGKQAAFI